MSSELDDYEFYPIEKLLSSRLQVFLLLFTASSEFTPDRFYGQAHPDQLSSTIDFKILKMQYAYEDFEDQIPTWRNIPQLIEDQGIDALGEQFRFALRYETYLNTIYSLCDSLGIIVQGIFPKERLPERCNQLKRNFNIQRKFLVKHKSDDPYSRLLAINDWYDGVHRVRSEATHNLSGFVTNSMDNLFDVFDRVEEVHRVGPNPTHNYSGLVSNWKDEIPGYLNQVITPNDDGITKVKVDNIIEHAKDLRVKVRDFLEAFGSVFLEVISPETSRDLWCLHKLSTNEIYMRTISPLECQGSKKGTCTSLGLECPGQDRCLIIGCATSDPKAT